MLNKDPEAKKARGYVEKDSFVRLDGSEVLKGKDWRKRVAELWKESDGRCQWTPVDALGEDIWPLRCRKAADDPHHIKPRSKGRDDRLSNLQALCRYHHNVLDQRKVGGRKQKRPK